jgi:hypothetical protein
MDMAKLIGEFLQLRCERAKSDTKRRNGSLEATEQVSDASTVLPTADVHLWARNTTSLVQRVRPADQKSRMLQIRN